FFIEKVRYRVIQSLHTVFFADLQHAWDLEGFCFANQVRNGGCHNKDLECCNPTLNVHALKKVLGDDTLQCLRQRIANLVLLPGWKYIDDAVDRFRSAWRVQGSKYQVARGRSR